MKHNNSPEKDFWDRSTVVITTKDRSLNSAHAEYLESRMIEMAFQSQNAKVENSQQPQTLRLSLSEADRSSMEYFLEQVQTLLPVLGFDFLSIVPKNPLGASVDASAASAVPQDDVVTFVLSSGGVTAEAEEINNQFIVRAKSQANPNETPAIGATYSALRKNLRSGGELVDDEQTDKLEFTKDVVFNSPSAAAKVITGASVSGPALWKVKGTQQSYGDWQQAQVNAVLPKAPSPQIGTAETAAAETGLQDDGGKP